MEVGLDRIDSEQSQMERLPARLGVPIVVIPTTTGSVGVLNGDVHREIPPHRLRKLAGKRPIGGEASKCGDQGNTCKEPEQKLHAIGGGVDAENGAVARH